MTSSAQKENSHWSLDKKVPLALVVTIIAQTFGIGYYVSRLENRVSNLEIGDITQKTFIDGRVKLNEDRWNMIQTDREKVADKLGRLDESIKFIVQGITRIEGKLDRSHQ